MFAAWLFENPLAYVSIVVLVVVSVVLHELGHAIAATMEGDPTPRLRGHFTWNPVVHMGWLALGMLLLVGWTFGRTPVDPRYFRHRRWGEVLVAAAGPLVNLFLAVVASVVVALLGLAGTGETVQFARFFWSLAVHLNVTLFLLNMIPVPPLDGFTVAEGAFDLGDLGRWIRGLGFFPLIVAILIVNSSAFDAVRDFVSDGIQRSVGQVFALFGA